MHIPLTAPLIGDPTGASPFMHNAAAKPSGTRLSFLAGLKPASVASPTMTIGRMSSADQSSSMPKLIFWSLGMGNARLSKLPIGSRQANPFEISAEFGEPL